MSSLTVASHTSQTSKKSKTNQQSSKSNLPTSMPCNANTAINAPEPSFLLRAGRKESEQSYSYKCCIENCKNTNISPGVSFTTIPKKPIAKANMKKTEKCPYIYQESMPS